MLGPIAYGSSHGDNVFLRRDFNNTQDYSESTASLIDSEIKRIVTEAYNEAERLLRENIDKLHFIAEYLVKNESMDGEQFAAVMNGDPTVEELEAMVADKKRISEEENRLREEYIRRREAEREAERAREEARRRHSGTPGTPGMPGNMGNPGDMQPPVPPTPPKNDGDDNGENK